VARTALITGISGQDGSYLAEFLIDKGYRVHGVMRPTSSTVRHTPVSAVVHRANLIDAKSVGALLERVQPDEIYHLAGPSYVGIPLAEEAAAYRAIVNSTRLLLDGLQALVPSARFFFAGSSEIFAAGTSSPQTENSPVNPRSLYGFAKLVAQETARLRRRRYGLFACTGVLYNHESPRRDEIFLPRKVVRAAARISLGLQDKLFVGNVEARRDWGFAPDYVDAMWRMLQSDAPEDFIIATGRTYSVRELIEAAFARVGLAYDAHVVVDPRFYRPTESFLLVGSPRRIAERLDWKPAHSFEAMIATMVDAELKHAEAGS